MDQIKRRIVKSLQGAANAFRTFPMSIASAVLFAIVTMVRIQLDWPAQEPYNFLFNCLHLAFAVGALFSLMTITAAKSRFGDKKSFYIANALGALAILVTFLTLYFFGADESSIRYTTVSTIAGARVSAVLFISLLGFVILAGDADADSDFSRALFMTHKAFFIAFIYGVVLMAGTSGVAGAIETLLLPQMSEKVYGYLATLSGFTAFTIFVGYFPHFEKGGKDPHRKVAEEQPRFIEVLFGTIMIPILLALTIVLLLWTARTLFGNIGYSFVQLSSIATAYAFYGFWLLVMTKHHDSTTARLYRRVFPYAALVILSAEAWALWRQLSTGGLKYTEYGFLIVWIFAIKAVVLLLFTGDKAHRRMALLACFLAFAVVLPGIGYHELPVAMQVDRLEGLLAETGILADGELNPASATIPDNQREKITDSVYFLAGEAEARLPEWFDRDLNNQLVFEETLGFSPLWPEGDNQVYPGRSNYLGTSMRLKQGAMRIDGYEWMVRLDQYDTFNQEPVVIEGEKATYRLHWIVDQRQTLPTLRIEKGEDVILEDGFDSFIDQTTEKYPPGEKNMETYDVQEMSTTFETEDLRVLVVFRTIEINVDVQQDEISYWIELDALYLDEQ